MRLLYSILAVVRKALPFNAPYGLTSHEDEYDPYSGPKEMVITGRRRCIRDAIQAAHVNSIGERSD